MVNTNVTTADKERYRLTVEAYHAANKVRLIAMQAYSYESATAYVSDYRLAFEDLQRVLFALAYNAPLQIGDTLSYSAPPRRFEPTAAGHFSPELIPPTILEVWQKGVPSKDRIERRYGVKE